MTLSHQSIDILIGLLFSLISLTMVVFPPKFGNPYYGISTKWTLKNETLWGKGQKLFAISISLISFVFIIIGIFKLREDIPSYLMVLILIGLWTLSKVVVHEILERKYPMVR